MDRLGTENTHDDEDVVRTRPSSANVSAATNPDPALPAENNNNNIINNNNTQLTPPHLPQNRNRRPSTIRIRWLPSATSVLQTAENECDKNTDNSSDGRQQGPQQATGRGRSISEPRRLQWTVPTSDLIAQDSRFPQIEEGKQSQRFPPSLTPAQHYGSDSFLRKASLAAGSALRLRKTNNSTVSAPPVVDVEYDSDDVNLLDIVDPEVSTLSTLTNVQNSLFVPDLGRLINRRMTYSLTPQPITIAEQSMEEVIERKDTQQMLDDIAVERARTRDSITSKLSASHFAVLPHGTALLDWSREDKQALNDHVRHMLHSRRSKFKRGMKGFGQYVRRPLGFLVTLYATLITVFGLAWVLFLIGWIQVGARKDYIINVIDNIMVALFAIVGDGLIPFRIIDTYHMIFIAHYHHLTWRLRRERALPTLHNENDLPSIVSRDVENGNRGSDTEEEEFSVLTRAQQERLDYHQKLFSRSHTFYKPHETVTHNAFPLRLLVAVVVLLDCHSMFQVALGTCTWAISYHVRPFALTTVILSCSITCNITAGVLIFIGDHKTRKKEVVEKMLRQELTLEALKKLEKKRSQETGEQVLHA